MSPAQAIHVLKKRSDFLAVAAVRQKWTTPAFIVQVAPRPDGNAVCGLGLTTSKKMVGNAVQRNRARRRLRALAREVLSASGKRGVDYVLIAREAALTRAYEDLRKDLLWALTRLKMKKDGA